MSDETKSQTELLEQEIQLAVSRGFDFSLKTNRAKFLEDFCLKKYPKRKMSPKKIRPTFNRLLDKKLPHDQIKRTTRKPRFNTELAAKITEKSSGIKDQELKPQGETPKVALDKDGKPIIATPAQKYEHFDAEGVGATFQAFLMTLRTVWPELEGLTKEEKESIGRMWLPAFQRYLSEKMAYIVFPALATIGIILPKVQQARVKKKLRQQAEAKNKQTEKATQEEKERSNLLSCRFCTKQFKPEDLPVHERTCDKRGGMLHL